MVYLVLHDEQQSISDNVPIMQGKRRLSLRIQHDLKVLVRIESQDHEVGASPTFSAPTTKPPFTSTTYPPEFAGPEQVKANEGVINSKRAMAGMAVLSTPKQKSCGCDTWGSSLFNDPCSRAPRRPG